MKTPVYVSCLVLFSHFVQLVHAGNGTGSQEKCPSSFDCGNLGMIQFPFTVTERQDCGLLAIHGCDNHVPNPSQLRTIKWNDELPFAVLQVRHSTIVVRDLVLHGHLESRNCKAFNKNFTLPPNSPLASFHAPFNITLFRCKRTLNVSLPKDFFKYTNCPDYDIFYGPPSNDEAKSFLSACSITQLPSKDYPDTKDPFTFISSEIFLKVQSSPDCDKCYSSRRGRCQLDSNKIFTCAEEKRSQSRKLGLGLGLGIGVFVTLVISILIIWLCKRKYASSKVQFHSRDSSYSNSDPETGSAYFGIPVFSYKELEEATNNFDSARELGDGGFGTVYYGKLQDGKEVAVKRLYEHNYRRVEQFMNEVKILTRLRHKNLVSLYGCTSHQSQDLLLVYEYIPNGTIASHLHGDLAKPGLLPWAVRMKLAIETATALAYLHATEIIHRDVKTNNILLDNSYCVKVADFGLSRLFPNNVTHVSTAPQGTPGYVDPEYHQCYQLTSKSDVYSFGVVLIELISSMPAVDMSRHKDEINLSNLAIKKIQKSAFSELVDPYLGFESDNEVKRMIISVAELAFQCLQSEKELRPSMDEVLVALKRIERGEDEPEQPEEEDIHGAGISHSNSVQRPPLPCSPDWDEVGLLKNMKLPPSPNTVTDKWESESTTPYVSG